MNRYFIQHHIKTLAQLWEPFEYSGYKFSAWKIDYTEGHQAGWLAQKEVVQSSIDNAWKEFLVEFIEVVEKIAFVSQCYTSFELQPFIIFRNDRDEVFFRYAQERAPVPLHFNKDEIKSLENLESYTKNKVFTYLRESTNAGSFYTRFAMLVAALEAMAGEIETESTRTTDKKYIADKILLDTDLCNKIFEYGSGIRNQMLHGREIDLQIHGDIKYNEKIYESIIKYFNENYNLKVDTKIVNPQRTFPGTYHTWRGWLKRKQKLKPICLELLQDKFLGSDFSEYFEFSENPDDY